MKASLRSVRIAPKKAQLVAKMIRGKSVPDAMYTLERTNKKAARLFEQLLRSAMANASHNEKQDPQMLTVKLLTVNKAQAYHRGVPMARGRVRSMRKFLSHINLTLGVADEKNEKKPAKKVETASKEATKPVKKTTTSTKKSTSTKSKSAKKDTTASTSKSSASAKKKTTAKKTTTKKKTT